MAAVDGNFPILTWVYWLMEKKDKKIYEHIAEPRLQWTYM
jgi:hypothetical protein